MNNLPLAPSTSILLLMKIKKWQLLSKKDVSPSKWFPIELRSYKLPNGKIVDDFTITTLADVAMMVPVTPDEKIVLVKQYKPGYDDVILEFPAGRLENNHKNIEETALHELAEETGIQTNSLEYLGVFSGLTTKATEKVYCYLVENAIFNSQQHLDENEDIEVMVYNFAEIEALIEKNQINASVTVACWDLVKRKYQNKFASWK